MKKNLNKTFLFFLTGVLLALASPLYSLGYLVWFALVPFIYASIKSSFKENLINGFILQITFCLGVFFWVPESFNNLWGESYLLTIPLFLVLICFVELQFMVFPLIRKIIHIKYGHSLMVPFISAAFYVILDFLTLKFFKDTLGHAAYNQIFIKQLAAFGGVYLISFAIVVVNDLIIISLLRKKIPFSAICIFLGLNLTGYGIYQNSLSQESEKSATVIQFNLDFKEKDRLIKEYTESYSLVILDRIIENLKSSIAQFPKNKTIIFPESVLPVDLDNLSVQEEGKIVLFREIIKENSLVVLIGGKRSVNGLHTNSLIKLDEEVAYFDKIHLFPFGEYFPGREVIPFSEYFYPEDQVKNKGSQAGIFTIDGVFYGSAICYETITDDLSLKLSPLSEVIVNTSNETWFGSFGEQQLALGLTSFRAVENRRPILRVANTGISANISSQGEIESLPQNQAIIKSFSFIPSKKQSFFSQYPRLVILLSGIICLLVLLSWIKTYYHKNKRNK